MTKKDIMVGNFLGGLSWGVGSVLGATLVVGVILWLLSFVNFVPIVGDFLTQVQNQTKQQVDRAE